MKNLIVKARAVEQVSVPPNCKRHPEISGYDLLRDHLLYGQPVLTEPRSEPDYRISARQP